jgi:DNA-binding CsgD family transcriptional regulator
LGEDRDDEARTRWQLAAVAAGAFALLLGLEVATEKHITPLELLLEVLELLLTLAAAAGVSLLVGRMQRQHEERMALLRDLEVARADGEGWRREVQAHIDGLGAAIEKQVRAWGLTNAEREVALLMLKGFSHKEIAALRNTSEATVRQQARSTYEKSGLNGRASFCAYFLEDLLPPQSLPELARDGNGRGVLRS